MAYLLRSNAAYGIGFRVTRHPRMGAVEELKVTLREPQSNQRLLPDPYLQL